MPQGARSRRAGRRMTTGRGRAPGAVSKFPAADRVNRSGHAAGDFCFACECRIVEIGGPGGIVLAWCECAWPEDHAEMQVF